MIDGSVIIFVILSLVATVVIAVLFYFMFKVMHELQRIADALSGEKEEQ